MQTRSKAKKANIPSTDNTTVHGDQGVRLHQEHDIVFTPTINGSNNLTTHNNTSTETFNSCLDGSLSSLSDDESSGSGSFNSIFDGSLSSVSSCDSVSSVAPDGMDCRETQPAGSTSQNSLDPSFNGSLPSSFHIRNQTPTMFDVHHNIQHFNAPVGTHILRKSSSSSPPNEASGSGPIRTQRAKPHSQKSPSRPLMRGNVQRWQMGTNGVLLPVAENVPMLLERGSRISNENNVFDREMEKLNSGRNHILLVLDAMGNTSDEEVDMRVDATAMFRPSGQPDQPQEQPIASGSGQQWNAPEQQRRLGPHGTEIIDGSFHAQPRAPSGTVYPEQWVTRRSTGLRTFPTEDAV